MDLRCVVELVELVKTVGVGKGRGVSRKTTVRSSPSSSWKTIEVAFGEKSRTIASSCLRINGAARIRIASWKTALLGIPVELSGSDATERPAAMVMAKRRKAIMLTMTMIMNSFTNVTLSEL